MVAVPRVTLTRSRGAPRREVSAAFRAPGHAGTRPHVRERTPTERRALIELVFCVSRLLDYD